MRHNFETVKPPRAGDERGVSLISYALLVSLIAIGGFTAVAAVGNQVSDDYGQIGGALGAAGTETTTTTTASMTPKEKWEKAQSDWDAAIDAANAKHASDVAAATADLEAAKAANNALPKAEKNAANKQASSEFNAAKQAAKAEQNAAKKAANDAKAAAKAEYQATK